MQNNSNISMKPSLGGAIKPPRSSNLELYRIIVMFLIVCHHYVVNSGLMEVLHEDPTSARSLFYYIFGAWGKTGINCFVLITGYFMCKSNITIKKFLKLYTTIVFYNVIIYVIFAIFGRSDLHFSVMLRLFLPFWNINSACFTDCFIVFYLFIPFINILVNGMNKIQHGYLCALCLFLYTGLCTFPFASVVMNYVSWFMVLYIIASYVRNYPFPIYEKLNIWIASTVLFLVLGILNIVVMVKTHDMPYKYVEDANSIFALLVSLSSFMLFKNIKIKYSRLINMIGASTFGVFLIHANCQNMRIWLWEDLLNVTKHFQSADFIMYSICSVCLVFFVCSLIDIMRAKLIEERLLDAFSVLVNLIINKWRIKRIL